MKLFYFTQVDVAVVSSNCEFNLPAIYGVTVFLVSQFLSHFYHHFLGNLLL